MTLSQHFPEPRAGRHSRPRQGFESFSAVLSGMGGPSTTPPDCVFYMVFVLYFNNTVGLWVSYLCSTIKVWGAQITPINEAK